MDKNFPPKNLFDLSRSSASNFLELTKILKKRATVLFLGSGVSASVGLPIWNKLIEKICSVFFEHWKREEASGKSKNSPPKELSIVYWEDYFWSEEIIKIAKEFAVGNSLLIAQQIKNCVREIDWQYLLRKCVYMGQVEFPESPLINALVKLCSNKDLVNSIVNYNYDSLLEPYLKDSCIPYSVVWSADCKPKPHSIPIYHPHGYLKLDGGPLTPLIITEDDYFSHTTIPYFWSNVVQLSLLSQYNCIFIGCSMTDPNIRRLLRTSKAISNKIHFAFLPQEFNEGEIKFKYQQLFDHDLISLNVHPIRFQLNQSTKEPYSRLPELLNLLTSF